MVNFDNVFQEQQNKKMDNGFFPVPHCIFDYDLSKEELLLMLTFYKLVNRYWRVNIMIP